MTLSPISLQSSNIPPVPIPPPNQGQDITPEIESNTPRDAGLNQQSSEERRQTAIVQLNSNQTETTLNRVEAPTLPQPEEVEFSNELIRIQEELLQAFEDTSDIPKQTGPLFEQVEVSLEPPQTGSEVQENQAQSLSYVDLVV